MENIIGFFISGTICIAGFWILWWGAEKYHEKKGQPLTNSETNIIQIIYLVLFLGALICAIFCFKVLWPLALMPGALATFLLFPLYLAFKRKLVW